MKNLIGTTLNGIKIYAIENNGHMAAHAGITNDLIAKAIKKIHYDGPFFMESIEMDTVVGKDNCVTVSEKDTVKLLYRKGREGRTPIVFGKEAEDTNLLTVGIYRDEDGLDTVFTAFSGAKAPREPWDSDISSVEEKSEAEEFWRNHALFYDESAIDPNRN